MDKIYLSKSKYCRAKQCNKILWLDKFKPEFAVQTASESVLENGTEVGILARELFGEHKNIEFKDDLSQMIEETNFYMNSAPNIITEASFNYNNNFCSVDILKNDKDGLEIYEVKSSTEVKDIYIDDVSYQVYVLLSLGYKVKSANIVYINSQYVRYGDLELDKLFNIKNVTEITLAKQDEIKTKIEEINDYMTRKNEEEKEIGMHCFEPYICDYWNYCTRNLPEKNVFKIRGMRKDKKFRLYQEGIYKFEDLLNVDINEKYKQQIEVDLYNKDAIIKKDEIRDFMNTLYYPLYFLDFETFQQAIPKYDGISPYMQIPFQYSLHYIEKEDGELQHKEFLAKTGIDPRRSLAERLVTDIPSNACVSAYNMKFEKMVIKQLAEIYEDLREDLMLIYENMKDLMIPFDERMYYTKEMEGSYSIKYVLPALFPNAPELDYHNLNIVHNGGEAMSAFAELEKKSKEEQERIRRSLLEYCKLDTFAMVKIWGKLKEI